MRTINLFLVYRPGLFALCLIAFGLILLTLGSQFVPCTGIADFC